MFEDAVLYSAHTAELPGQRPADTGREQVADVSLAESNDNRRRWTGAGRYTVDGHNVAVSDNELIKRRRTTLASRRHQDLLYIITNYLNQLQLLHAR